MPLSGGLRLLADHKRLFQVYVCDHFVEVDVPNLVTYLKAHSHLLVRAINERFVPARVTFRSVLASESHWLQPMLVLTLR